MTEKFSNINAANEIEHLVGALFQNVGERHRAEFQDALMAIHKRVGEMICERTARAAPAFPIHKHD